MFLVICMCALMVVPFVACEKAESTPVDPANPGTPTTSVVADLMGRQVTVKPGTYQRVVCIGAGALRLYSYICGADNLAAVEDIDNTTATGRPAMFDGTARPYQMAYQDTFDMLPSCGKGGPQAQGAETEKIAEMIPGATLRIVEGHDHGSYIAGSEIMGEMLIEFLKEKYQ